MLYRLEFDDDETFYLLADRDGFRFMAACEEQPTLTIWCDRHATCLELMTGRQSGMSAFLAGQYRADGNIVLSQVLLYLFRDEAPDVRDVQD